MLSLHSPGFGAPWYDSYARATIFGLHRGANKYDVIKATLDSLGYQTRDIANAMAKDAGAPIKLLRIDGGAANNNIVAQFVADILGADAERPVSVETTAAGAASCRSCCWILEEQRGNSCMP